MMNARLNFVTLANRLTFYVQSTYVNRRTVSGYYSQPNHRSSVTRRLRRQDTLSLEIDQEATGAKVVGSGREAALGDIRC
jgi:hypothetical protein